MKGDFEFATGRPAGALGDSALGLEQALREHLERARVYTGLLEVCLDESTTDDLRAAGRAFLEEYRLRARRSEDALRSQIADHVALCRRSLEFVTPREAARLTDVAESTWRARAASGDVPGALKKGKQWLLPAAEVQAGRAGGGDEH
jgi:cytosine/adenosine deaminase-related metal-dependent hydrolase